MAEKTEYKKIPKMSTNSAGAPIAVNPKKIPLTWTNEILKELYDFDTDIDAEPTWKTNSFKTYTTDVTTNTVTYEGDGGVCDQPGSSGSTSTTTKLTLHRWYTVARDQENLKKGRAGVWIRRTGLTDATDSTSTAYRLRTPRTTGTGGLNSGASIHPPAIPIKPVPPPQPQPTFVPTAPKPSKLKIDPSISKAFKYSNGKLKAKAPEDDCDDDVNPVLVYDMENEEMKWECREEGGVSCCPALIYDGQLVVGVTDQGDLVTVSMDGYTYANPFEAHDYILPED
jgi:hypothetical protein